MASEVLLVFCTFPNSEVAARAAREVVEARLAACANILPQVHSIYRWEGKVESAEEVLAIFKLEKGCYNELEAKIRSIHPYEVPEIIAFPLSQGLPDYLKWVAESCSGDLPLEP